jgi:hypothetical protein
MGCCGRRETQPGGRLKRARHGSVLFEHRGRGPLVVHGHATGMRYHFPAGARLGGSSRRSFSRIIRGLGIVTPAT